MRSDGFAGTLTDMQHSVLSLREGHKKLRGLSRSPVPLQS